MRIIKCEVCGIEIKITNPKSRQKYCNICSCKKRKESNKKYQRNHYIKNKEYYREKYKETYIPKGIRTVKCEQCGTDIIAHISTKKYCKDCMRIKRYKLTKEWYSKNYIPKFRIIKCEKCNKDVKTNHSRQKYCAKCSKIRKKELGQSDKYKEKKREYSLKKRKVFIIKCEVCLVEIKRKNSMHKFCKKCAKKIQLDRSKEFMKEKMKTKEYREKRNDLRRNNDIQINYKEYNTKTCDPEIKPILEALINQRKIKNKLKEIKK